MIYIVFPVLCIFHMVVLVLWPDVFILKLLSKIAPIVLLLASSVLDGKWKTRVGIWLGIGLVFSLFGDAILAFPKEYFVFGLASFLVAQVAYSVSFSIGNPVHFIRFVPYVIFGGGFYYWILPGIGTALQVPVVLYVTAICIMGWRSAAREVSQRDLLLGAIGALVFISSDCLIALAQFTPYKLPFHSVFIIGTYYLAQILIYLSQEEEE